MGTKKMQKKQIKKNTYACYTIHKKSQNPVIKYNSKYPNLSTEAKRK